MATTSSAPTITGGAGEGIPKARQAKPIANASARPTSDLTAKVEADLMDAPLQQTIGCHEAKRHCHQQKSADQARRRWRRNNEDATTRADQKAYQKSQ